MRTAIFVLSNLEVTYLSLHTAGAGIAVSWCRRLQGSSWNHMAAWQPVQLELSFLRCYASTYPAL